MQRNDWERFAVLLLEHGAQSNGASDTLLGEVRQLLQWPCAVRFSPTRLREYQAMTD